MSTESSGAQQNWIHCPEGCQCSGLDAIIRHLRDNHPEQIPHNQLDLVGVTTCPDCGTCIRAGGRHVDTARCSSSCGHSSKRASPRAQRRLSQPAGQTDTTEVVVPVQHQARKQAPFHGQLERHWRKRFTGSTLPWANMKVPDKVTRQAHVEWAKNAPLSS